jgi:hypothetical protein
MDVDDRVGASELRRVHAEGVPRPTPDHAGGYASPPRRPRGDALTRAREDRSGEGAAGDVGLGFLTTGSDRTPRPDVDLDHPHDQHLRAVQLVGDRAGPVKRQEMAALTSSATRCSTAGVHLGMANETGHRSPSSRWAESWNSRVE